VWRCHSPYGETEPRERVEGVKGVVLVPLAYMQESMEILQSGRRGQGRVRLSEWEEDVIVPGGKTQHEVVAAGISPLHRDV
jgi:hypothetical protein